MLLKSTAIVNGNQKFLIMASPSDDTMSYSISVSQYIYIYIYCEYLHIQYINLNKVGNEEESCDSTCENLQKILY